MQVWFGLLGFNASATARVISRRRNDGLVYWGLTPQQQPGSHQGGEMMMMKSVFWWRKPEYPEGTCRSSWRQHCQYPHEWLTCMSYIPPSTRAFKGTRYKSRLGFRHMRFKTDRTHDRVLGILGIKYSYQQGCHTSGDSQGENVFWRSRKGQGMFYLSQEKTMKSGVNAQGQGKFKFKFLNDFEGVGRTSGLIEKNQKLVSLFCI